MYYWIELGFIVELLDITKNTVTYRYSYYGLKRKEKTTNLLIAENGKKFFWADNTQVFLNQCSIG